MIKRKKERYIIFFLAVFLSALGNALPAYSDAGAAPWTAACINVKETVGLEIGTILNIFFVGFYLFNKFYTKEKLSLKKDGTLILFVIAFGMLINVILDSLYFLYDGPINPFLGGAISLFGSVCVACAVSLFIKVDILMLPIDDFIKNLTTICNNNVVISGLISFGLGIGIAVIFGLFNGNILAVNYITIINFLFFGAVINFFNKNLNFVDNYIVA